MLAHSEDSRVGITGAYDSVDARATEFAQRFDTCAYHDLGALLSSDADTVLITTPPSSHYALIKACPLAGMSVVCENPFALSRTDAIDAIALADDTWFRRCTRSTRSWSSLHYRM